MSLYYIVVIIVIVILFLTWFLLLMSFDFVHSISNKPKQCILTVLFFSLVITLLHLLNAFAFLILNRFFIIYFVYTYQWSMEFCLRCWSQHLHVGNTTHPWFVPYVHTYTNFTHKYFKWYRCRCSYQNV